MVLIDRLIKCNKLISVLVTHYAFLSGKLSQFVGKALSHSHGLNGLMRRFKSNN